MIKALKTAGSVIDKISIAFGILGAVFLVLTACIVTFEVVSRSFFNSPTTWSFDISIYLILAAMFLTASYTARQEGHINVDFLTSRLSGSTRAILEAITLTWTVVFCLVLLWSSARMLNVSIAQHIRDSTFLGTPLAVPQGAFFVGIVVLTLQLIKMTVERYDSAFKRNRDENDKAEASFMRAVDKPWILVPLVLGLLAIATVLFSIGGTERTIGLVIMLLTVLATGTSVFAAVGLVGCVGLLFLLGGGLQSQVQTAIFAYKPLTSFVVGAIPLFILGAGILSTGGLGTQLYDVCLKWFPPVRGKLAMATVAACAVFAAISGSSIANAAAFSLIAVPPMLKLGYDKRLAYGVVAGGGTLGILIPPSGTFIMYGYLTGESVGKLFIAGIIPGIMVAFFFIVYVFLKCRRDDRYLMETRTKYTWKERFSSLASSLPILFAPLLILGSIYAGIATPTEAAAIAVVYAILLVIIRKQTSFPELITTLLNATKNGSMVLMILAGATIFGGVITIMHIPQNFIAFAVNANIPVWGILAMISLLLIILGMFMEGVAIVVIALPIIYPAIIAMGLDPIWYGVVYVIIAEMGQLTPPVGMNLYAIRGTTGARLEDIMYGSIPFLVILLISLIIICAFPALSTWLPSTMMK